MVKKKIGGLFLRAVKVVFGLFFVLAFLVISQSDQIAKAQNPAVYASEYTQTNLYTSDGVLAYHFSGLDINTDYVWLLQGFSPNEIGLQALGRKFSSGSTTADVAWTVGLGDFDRVSGAVYNGPARVIDVFGNIVGTHYLLAGCNFLGTTECENKPTEWIEAGGINTVINRIGIGDHFNTLDRNSDGWFHPTKNVGAVSVTLGETTILHYNTATTTTDQIRIFNLNNSTAVYTIELQDLVDYQIDVRNSVLTPQNAGKNFVVLNTLGTELTFVNKVQENAAFNAPASGANPHELFFSTGGYDYIKTDSVGAHIADGESTMIVTESSGAGREWTLRTGNANIRFGSNMTVQMQSASRGVWDSGLNDHQLDDDLQGTIDTDNYAFIPTRFDVYLVAPIASVAVSTFTVRPTLSNLNTAVLIERQFEIDLPYTITATGMNIGERIEVTLNGIGFDTTLGRTLAMLLLIVIVLVILANKGHGSFQAGSMVYLIIGGAWIVAGKADTLTTILFAISAMIILFLLVRMQRGNKSGESFE